MLEDEIWKEHRNIISPAFHFQKLQVAVPFLVRAADIFCDKLHNLTTNQNESVEIEIHKELAQLSLDAVCSATFGHNLVSQPDISSKFVDHTNRILQLVAKRVHLSLFPGLLKLPLPINKEMKQLCNWVKDTVRQMVDDRVKDQQHQDQGFVFDFVFGFVFGLSFGFLF